MRNKCRSHACLLLVQLAYLHFRTQVIAPSIRVKASRHQEPELLCSISIVLSYCHSCLPLDFLGGLLYVVPTSQSAMRSDVLTQSRISILDKALLLLALRIDRWLRLIFHLLAACGKERAANCHREGSDRELESTVSQIQVQSARQSATSRYLNSQTLAEHVCKGP